MIRVCVINPNYYRSSGVTVAIKSIFNSVSDKGIATTFVTCDYGNDTEDLDWIPDEKLTSFKLMANNPFVLLYNILILSAWLRTNKIDVVHTHHRRIAILLNIFSFLFKSKILYTGALTYPFSFLFRVFCPEHVVAITESVKKNIIATTKVKNINLIGNPTLFPSSVPIINKNEVCNGAICIARLEKVKGHHNLIKAWSILKARGLNYTLTLVGEGSLHAELHDLIVNLGLENQIYFKGYTSDVELEIKKNMFAILVSEVEGQGIVTIESASVGRASILTDVDGSRDCLPPNRILPNGLPYGDIVALANCIEYWFSHPEEVIKEGELFFDYHKKHNSMQVIGEKYANLYQYLKHFQ